MKTNIIKIFKGNYSNSDAYERVISYIYNKACYGGYGFPVPATADSIIQAFYLSEANSDSHSERKIWHLTVSIKNLKSHKALLLLANTIAGIFANNYQVVYSLDLEPGHYHLHFGVNAYSYKPTAPILTYDFMKHYANQIKSIVSDSYPTVPTKLINEGDK